MKNQKKNRFSRQNKIKWFKQKKLDATCMIVGCGGIGCWTALQLTMLGIKRLILVDMDTVDESNLNRQFFYEEDISKLKVDSLKEKLLKINSKVDIISYTDKVESVPQNFYRGVDFVFDCLDNIPTREFLSKLCWENNIPFIHSACSDMIGEVQLVIKDKTKPMREYPEEMKKEKQSCLDFDAAVVTTNMITASLQVDKFLNYVMAKELDKPFTNYIRGNGITYG